MSEAKGRARKGFARLHEHGRHDDIRYRGPLSYQSFQVLGWLCIVASAAVFMIRLSYSVNTDMAIRLNRADRILSAMAELALALMLISNFARILSNAEGYGRQLLRNGLAMLGVFIAFNVGFNHFFVGSLKLVSAKPNEVMPLVMETFHGANRYGFVAFNLFVDLFLCTLFMLMAVFIKTREWFYCRNGNTHEDYEAFLRTNRNSLHFSVCMALLLVIAGFADYFLLDFVSGSTEVVTRMPVGIAAGIGDSIMLIFVAPLMLLLSYNRAPRLKGNDILIPVAGVALMVIVVLQGGYQILAVSKVPPVDFGEVRTTLQELAGLMKMR